MGTEERCRRLERENELLRMKIEALESELRRREEELARLLAPVEERRGEKKTEILRIRTTKGLLNRWKVFVREGGFGSYHEALRYLLNTYAEEVIRRRRARLGAEKAGVEVEVFGPRTGGQKEKKVLG